MSALIKSVAVVVALLLSGCYVHPGHVRYDVNQYSPPYYGRSFSNNGAYYNRFSNSYGYAGRHRGVYGHHHYGNRAGQYRSGNGFRFGGHQGRR